MVHGVEALIPVHTTLLGVAGAGGPGGEDRPRAQQHRGRPPAGEDLKEHKGKDPRPEITAHVLDAARVQRLGDGKLTVVVGLVQMPQPAGVEQPVREVKVDIGEQNHNRKPRQVIGLLRIRRGHWVHEDREPKPPQREGKKDLVPESGSSHSGVVLAVQGRRPVLCEVEQYHHPPVGGEVRPVTQKGEHVRFIG